MKHFLEIRDLSVRASGLELSFPFLKLEQGKTHCLVGRSGSGKSLLAAALAGLPVPGIAISGQILFDEEPASVLWKDHVFLLPQEPALALDPTMPVGKQIDEVLKWRRAADCAWTNVGGLAHDVGLTEEDLTKMPAALSGGMQQRALIAMVLAAKASFVIADEPTKGLDTHNRNRVIELLKKLQSLGRGLLVISHDLDVARSLADVISVVDAGGVVEEGQAESMLKNPQCPATRKLFENEPARWPISTQSNRAVREPLVQLVSVSFGFDRHRPLIDNISLTIHRGEIVGLYGPSGIGKSTLGDICLALNTPGRGSIHWAGQAATPHLIKQHRTRFQKLFQNPVTAFPPNLKLAVVFRELTLGSGQELRNRGSFLAANQIQD